MVTKEDLIQLNPAYDSKYGVSDSDVAKANRLIKNIEKNLRSRKPQVGDMVCGSYYRGTSDYDHGIIERRFWDSPDVVSVCYHPYVPFAAEREEEINLSVSGGPFTSANQCMFEFVGETERTFCDFGHCGPCAGGAFNFKARVKKWRLKDFNARFPWTSFGKLSVCEVENPELIHSAEYANWIQKGDLINVYFDDEKKVKACAVYDGVSVSTTIQKLEHKLTHDKRDLGPQILALKLVAGEWVDVKASKAFKSENPLNHQRYAVITMVTEELTDEPSLCLQLHDGEFVYVNDYIGLRKVCTNYDHIS